MTDSLHSKPCYIPLNLISQSNNENVLYYNASAPQDSIYECATGRINAAINLAENLLDYHTAPPTALQAFSLVFSLLLNDAYTLLEEVNPIAVQLRNENQQTNNKG